MTEPTLHEERDGAVMVLTLDYPARRNALAAPLRNALIEALERIEADPAVRAVVLTGAGGVFSSGGDIAGMDVATLAAGRERFRITHHLVRLLMKGSKPVLAAIEGWCAGGAVGLALCCDTVVAGDGARFMLSFGKIGLVPDYGLLYTLPRRVGAGRARQMMLYGDTVDAAGALQSGLVDQLVPAGTARATALALAQRLATAAPLPIAYTRQQLTAGLDAVLEWERDTQAALFLTADHAEGCAAFLGKRLAAFEGR